MGQIQYRLRKAGRLHDTSHLDRTLALNELADRTE